MFNLRATAPEVEEMSLTGVEAAKIPLVFTRELLLESLYNPIPESLGLLADFTVVGCLGSTLGCSRYCMSCGDLCFCVTWGPAGLVGKEVPPPIGAELNDRDLGIVNVVGITTGELGEGLLLLDSGGLDPGVVAAGSRLCRKLELLVRQSSVSNVGSPVADVVVVHVLVDIRRSKLGGKLRRSRWNKKTNGKLWQCILAGVILQETVRGRYQIRAVRG